jgi:hypothetical protein
MTEPVSRLQAALAERYRIERELGQGGTATVYLAEDLKHHRKVALKVLRPELAATLGPERFAREIEVAACRWVSRSRPAWPSPIDNYLRLRVDPEPSRIPQLDSVRAELRALGDLKVGS